MLEIGDLTPYFFDPREIQGCSDDDIEQLSTTVGGASIPKAFQDWLKLCGRKLGWFHPVDTFFYPNIQEENVWLRKIWKEEFGFKTDFPHDGLVIAAHGGYQWWFIKCNEQDPLSIWYFERDDAKRPSFKQGKNINTWATGWAEQIKEDFNSFQKGFSKINPIAFGKVIKHVYDMLDYLHAVNTSSYPKWNMVLKNYEHLSYQIYDTLRWENGKPSIHKDILGINARVDHLLSVLEPHPTGDSKKLLDLSLKTIEAIVCLNEKPLS